MRAPLFLLGLSTPQLAPITQGFLSPLWLLGLSGETGVIPPVFIRRGGGHNDDDEVMGIVMAFMGVIANGNS